MKVSKFIKTLISLLTCVLLMTSCINFKSKPSENPKTTENIFSTNEINVLVHSEDDAYKALDSVSQLYGFNNAREEFKTENIATLDTGTHYRFSQVKNGVPVYARTMIVSADENGNIFNLNGNYSKIAEDFNTTPKINNHKAQKVIKSKMGKDLQKTTISEPELVIYADGDTPALSWKADVAGYTRKGAFEAYEVIADANKGNVLHKSSSVNYAQIQKEETGHNGGRQTITVEENEDNGLKQYQLYDESRGIYVYKPIDKYYWYQDGKAELISWQDGETPDESGVDALANVSKAYDFFKKLTFHKNNDMKIFVHVEDMKYPNKKLTDRGVWVDENGYYFGNAFQYMGALAFTIVDPQYDFAEGSTHLDIVAHEYTHYVSEQISNFKSVGDKCINAAINEAYSDIFGELVEDAYYPEGTDWIHGERNLKNPSESVSQTEPFLSTFDNNAKISSPYDCYRFSTIISHSAYLMWEGDENSGAITDTTELAKLWYNSLYMLNSQSNFSDCRTAVETSANRLRTLGILTDEQVQRVSEAFNQVGIDPNPLYEIVAVNPKLHVYSADNSEYFNYHCKIEKGVMRNLRETKTDKADYVLGLVNIDFEVMEEFDITTETAIDLGCLVESPFPYRITISDLNDEPGTTQTKHVTVSHNSQNPLDFYTDFKTHPWKQAYIDYINTHRYYEDRFKLIYINNDNIPELYIDYSYTVRGIAICTYHDKLVAKHMEELRNYNFSYLEGKNMFRISGFARDYSSEVHYDKIYSIENGQFISPFNGSYRPYYLGPYQFDSNGPPIIYVYNWNDTKISSKEEYMNLLNSAFDTEQAIYLGDGLLNYEEIITAINNY